MTSNTVVAMRDIVPNVLILLASQFKLLWLNLIYSLLGCLAFNDDNPNQQLGTAPIKAPFDHCVFFTTSIRSAFWHWSYFWVGAILKTCTIHTKHASHLFNAIFTPFKALFSGKADLASLKWVWLLWSTPHKVTKYELCYCACAFHVYSIQICDCKKAAELARVVQRYKHTFKPTRH